MRRRIAGDIRLLHLNIDSGQKAPPNGCYAKSCALKTLQGAQRAHDFWEEITSELRLSGWRFDVASGDMYANDGESRLFEIIDRPMAERLIARMGRVSGAEGV